MKKNLLLRLLIVILMICVSLIAFTACDDSKEEDTRNQEIVEVYNAYVEYSQANGKEPLSYEDWLASIKGKDGRGIVKMEISDGYLYVIYTDAPNTRINLGRIQNDPCSHSWGGMDCFSRSNLHKRRAFRS